MFSDATPYRTMPDTGAERWEIRRGDTRARGWVDRPRGVGRVEHADTDDRTLLGELGRRYPGVRWFRDRAA